MHTTYFIQTLYGSDPCVRARAEKPLQNADFAMKQTNICRLSGDINNHHKLATSPSTLAQVLQTSLAQYCECTISCRNLQLVANHSVPSSRWYQPLADWRLAGMVRGQVVWKCGSNIFLILSLRQHGKLSHVTNFNDFLNVNRWTER